MGKYTTKDLKKEVDRLNKEYKKTDRTAIKFVFGKTDSGDYYIGTRPNGKWFNKDDDWRVSVSRDLDRLINDVREPYFKKRKKASIERSHQIAMEEREHYRYLEKNNKNKKSRYIK